MLKHREELEEVEKQKKEVEERKQKIPADKTERRDKKQVEDSKKQRKERNSDECGGCGIAVDTRGVLCEACNCWWHFECEETTEEIVNKNFPAGTPYKCKKHRKGKETATAKYIKKENIPIIKVTSTKDPNETLRCKLLKIEEEHKNLKDRRR